MTISIPSQPGANIYTQGFGSRPENVEVPHYDSRAPTTTDANYPIGKAWIWVGNSSWILIGLTTVNGITTALWDADSALTGVTGPGASPLTLNTRAGQATFTGVSIAAGATQTFVINNSTIAGATTQIEYSMTGSTSGAAPTIQSVTNAAGTSTIVVTNGTGATTQVGNLTFTYVILN